MSDQIAPSVGALPTPVSSSSELPQGSDAYLQPQPEPHQGVDFGHTNPDAVQSVATPAPIREDCFADVTLQTPPAVPTPADGSANIQTTVPPGADEEDVEDMEEDVDDMEEDVQADGAISDDSENPVEAEAGSTDAR